MGKAKPRKANKKAAKNYLCPVCDNVAGTGTFTCNSCKPPRWVHYNCGGYTSHDINAAIDENRDELLTCNIHKV